MSTEPRGTAGQAAPATKRKHTIKKFVFSSATKETETPAHEINPESYQQPRPRSKTIEMTDEKVCFIHNHKIVRATKVYINVYHLWQKWINRALKTIGLGGGYHTAIEILGKEYHFGGCNQIDSGIFESRPLHQMKRSPHSNDFHMTESDWIAAEMSMHMGPLKKRQVVGLWSGSEADIDLLMRLLKEKGNWKGLNYKLLSFNCNHFVRDACDILLKHSKHFHPAKGMTSSDTMVPPYLFKLANFIKSRYLKCVVGSIEEDEVLPPDEEQFAFRGRARYSIASANMRDYHPSTSLYDPTRTYPGADRPDPHRRQSLPELRQLRVLALDNKPKTRRNSTQRVWNAPRPSLSIMNTGPTDQTAWSIPEESSSTSIYESKQSTESKRSEPSCSYRAPGTKTVKASTSRTTDKPLAHKQLNPVVLSSESNLTMSSGGYEKRLDGMPPRMTTRPSSNNSDDAFMRTRLSDWNTQTMHSTSSCTQNGDERSPMSYFIEEGLAGENLRTQYSLMTTFHEEQDLQTS